MSVSSQPNQYIFFLGNHPELSLVEIKHVLKSRGLFPLALEATDEYAMVTLNSTLNEQLQDVLGGSDRFGQLLKTFPNRPTALEVGALLFPIVKHDKKIAIGLSGLGVERDYLGRLGMKLKDWWQERLGGMRFILPTGSGTRLKAASFMAHRLDEPPNAELTIVLRREGSFSVFRTIAVQDIQAYEVRDTLRPSRNAKIGLLPPKLAQMMINIAVGALAPTSSLPPRILDPFCGVGTILQEGWLMDYKMTGSDASERMIKATKKNLLWLQNRFKINVSLTPRVFIHQADTRWSKRWWGEIDALVTEPFLGNPLRAPLPAQELARRMDRLGETYRQFFKVSWPILRDEGTIFFALPAWRAERRGEDWNLFPEAFLDALALTGYSKLQLGKLERGSILYARPDALVGRELTLWQKK